MVKEFLAQKGIEFEERDVSRDRNAAQELVSKTGQMGVPVTVIDGQTVIGFDRARLEQITGHKQRPSLGALVANASKITARQGNGITVGAYIGKVKPERFVGNVKRFPGHRIRIAEITPHSDILRPLPGKNTCSL